jgi:hypothetical protein
MVDEWRAFFYKKYRGTGFRRSIDIGWLASRDYTGCTGRAIALDTLPHSLASNCSTSQKNFLYMYSVQHSRFTRVLHSFPLYSSCWASRNRRCSQVSVVSLSPRLVTGANQWPPVLSHRHLPLHASKAPTTVPAVAAQCPEPSHLSTLRFAATAFLHPDPETRGSSAMEVLHLLLLLPLPQPLDLRNFGAQPVS